MIFKPIIQNSNWITRCEIALLLPPQNLIHERSTLVQVMAWHRQASSHYLSQCWPRSMSPYDVTRPQLVKCHLCQEITEKYKHISAYKGLNISCQIASTYTILHIPFYDHSNSINSFSTNFDHNDPTHLQIWKILLVILKNEECHVIHKICLKSVIPKLLSIKYIHYIRLEASRLCVWDMLIQNTWFNVYLSLWEYHIENIQFRIYHNSDSFIHKILIS